MGMIAFDTLKLYERLRAAGVPEAQAKAQAEAFAEALGDMMAERLATKQDLSRLPTREELREELAKELERFATKQELAELKSDLIRWVSGLMIAQAGLIVALVRLLG